MHDHQTGTPPTGEPAWLHGHSHEPNPAPPSADPTLMLRLPDGREQALSPADLSRLHFTTASCLIASTGHPVSGPFTFGGVRLAELVAAHWPGAWQYADVISADGFGNRVAAAEAHNASPPILLATLIDDVPLTRGQGLVRLIVPSETTDALRQVKWVAHIEVH